MKMNFYRLFLFMALAWTIFAEGRKNKCDRKMDLAILLDASASIGDENFKLAKDLVKNLARRFEVSRDKVRVCVISYSQHINIFPTFSDYQDEKSIENNLEKHFFEGSSTGTGKTLEAVNFEVFSEKAGARIKRPDVREVAVVVTDGYSSIGTETVKRRADLMKSRGIEMFAIGITNRIKTEEMNALSSEPVKRHSFKLTGSEVVKEIADSIVKQVCK